MKVNDASLDPRYQQLAPQAREVADAIGVDACLKLIEARGGTRIFIPATCDQDHWLSALLGKKTAKCLCKAFSVAPEGKSIGAYIELPIGHGSALERARREAYDRLHDALDKGASEVDAVRASGLSRYTVMREKKRRASRSNDAPPLLALMIQPKS